MPKHGQFNKTVGKVLTEGKPVPDENKDFRVEAEWGRMQQNGVMPGPGTTTVRDYTKAELEALKATAKDLGLTQAAMLELVGSKTVDVYLNKTTCWSNIPEKAWQFVLAGQPVIKKWLSYREHSIMKRDLTADEVKWVREVARRITCLLLLTPELDANYSKVVAHPAQWPPKKVGTGKLPVSVAK